jgi:hypothetical protein
MGLEFPGVGGEPVTDTAAESPAPDGRPAVAVIITSYFAGSHADVCVTRLIEGYPWHGRQVPSRVRVVSMYLEQLGDHFAATPRPDIGVEIADRNGIPRFDTVAEAIGCGRPGVAVDGVVIVGEHGDYEFNEFGQQLYPRRRLFDAAVATMIAAGRTVPVFTDKHLAWSFPDALAMYRTARRLGIPLLAGSSVPLTYRVPRGTRWPAGRAMTGAVQVGYGPTDRYGFHIVEALQAATERRNGGETGIVAVRGLTGAAARTAVRDGIVDPELLDRALGTFELSPAALVAAKESTQDVYLIEYADGLHAAGVNIGQGIKGFATALRGPGDRIAYRSWMDPKPHRHFIFLVRQIESLILTGREPYPVERTLLTTGVMDAVMHSLHDGGVRRETPELAVSYPPADEVPDTGVDEPLPAPATGEA